MRFLTEPNRFSFALTLWKNIGVQIGGAKIPNYSRDLFFYQAYVRALMELDPDVMATHLRSALCQMDTDGSLFPSDANAGLSMRYALAGNSKTFHYRTPLLVNGLSGWRNGTSVGVLAA